mgnify:FL=1
MSNRAQTGKLRRELRFSKSAIEANLRELGKELSQVRPLVDAFMDSDGLLTLYGSELLLLEKALGIGFGEPAVQLVGELVSVKSVPPGTGISYGYLAKTEQPTNLGLVAIGFSDGIPRVATNQVSVVIDNKSFRSIGRIAMDQLVVDLQDLVPELGAEVKLFTHHFPLSEWSRVTGFTQLEILGRITARVERTWAE